MVVSSRGRGRAVWTAFLPCSQRPMIAISTSRSASSSSPLRRDSNSSRGSISYDDDPAAPNAFAHPMTLGDPERLPSGAKLVRDRRLWRELTDLEVKAAPLGPPSFTIAAILAHELGHIMQAQAEPILNPGEGTPGGFPGRLVLKHIKRTVFPALEEGDVLASLYKKGDNGFHEPNHHGTREERLNAFLAGFKVHDDDVNAAYAKGVEYIKQHPPSKGPSS